MRDRFTDLALCACGPEGDADEALVAADYFLERDEPRLAASALDRAYGLRPGDAPIVRQRQAVLDSLAVVEHGLCFRYVPAGTFLMGSEEGEADESPVHPVRLRELWMADIPITWAALCDLNGCHPPPDGTPRAAGEAPADEDFWSTKIRLQYCETETQQAQDWHVHLPDELFGSPARDNPSRPFAYDTKPVVAISWGACQALGQRISTGQVEYRLPTEEEWERAARGGLIGARHPWGDAPPTPDLCDCDHFDRFMIQPPRLYPPNGYGLHGMCGGVWEWTLDDYDALAYLGARPPVPEGTELQKVLRGGSWADCGEVCTVSFRLSRSPQAADAPVLGFRLCRVETVQVARR